MAKGQPTPRPTDAVLVALARACQRNASQLVGEADLLLGHGHFARALALAHTACEEAAKVNLVGDVLEGATPWSEFDAVFRDHSGKYAYLSRTVTYSDPSGVDAKVTHNRKLGGPEFKQRQRALFVDLVNGSVVEPKVTKPQVESVIKAARGELQALTLQRFLTGGTGVRSGMAGAATLRASVRRRRTR